MILQLLKLCGGVTSLRFPTTKAQFVKLRKNLQINSDFFTRCYVQNNQGRVLDKTLNIDLLYLTEEGGPPSV